MEKFNLKNKILIGITLFSMFFGAGNLIFPPYLGAQAGTSTLPAFVGFAISAVGLPVLGVVAVTLAGGLDQLASRVHPGFAFVYILILYLAIGPCLAIPRTASTSFSMAVIPFLPADIPAGPIQFLYSVIFFAAASAVAMHPERLTEYLGKKLTPVLLILIVVLFAASVLDPAGDPARPGQLYRAGASVQGFLDGYQTMDTLAALNFGMIVALNIQERGIRQKKAGHERNDLRRMDRRYPSSCSIFNADFCGNAFRASIRRKQQRDGSSGQHGGFSVWKDRYGDPGGDFVIACFNTCVGLFSCCGKYFADVFPKISYRNWVLIFAFVSMVIANVGLDMILKFSVPVLNAIYPMAILLIFLSCTHRWLGRFPGVYLWSAVFCGVSSVMMVLDQNGVSIPGISFLLQKIPGYGAGFGWLLPTAAGILAGIVLGYGKKKLKNN